MRFKGEITRGLIDHIEMWANVYRQNSRWSKSDINASEILGEIRKEINKNKYQKNEKQKKVFNKKKEG